MAKNIKASRMIGKRDAMYAVSLIFMCLAFLWLSARYDEYLRLFVSHSEVIDGVEYLERFETSRKIALMMVAAMASASIMFHLTYLRLLVTELEVFRRVLRKSATTNMLVNTHSFSLPAMQALAESYNAYARKKMEEYRLHTISMTIVSQKQSQVDTEAEKNRQIFDSVPYPVYTVFIDEAASITWGNKPFRELCMIGEPEGLPESCLVDLDQKAAIEQNTRYCVRMKEPTVMDERRNYAGRGATYKVHRSPIIDRQGMVILIVVVLVEKSGLWGQDG